jgi:hypothetical protein
MDRSLRGEPVAKQDPRVALIEAIRADSDLVAHAREIDYAARIRAQADRIEEELGHAD